MRCGSLVSRCLPRLRLLEDGWDWKKWLLWLRLYDIVLERFRGSVDLSEFGLGTFASCCDIQAPWSWLTLGRDTPRIIDDIHKYMEKMLISNDEPHVVRDLTLRT